MVSHHTILHLNFKNFLGEEIPNFLCGRSIAFPGSSSLIRYPNFFIGLPRKEAEFPGK